MAKRSDPANACPKITPILVMGDNARLLAQISALMGERNTYLPVLDGPRITRQDADAEVVRRNNAAAMLKPTVIILAGLPGETCDLFNDRFPSSKVRQVNDIADMASVPHGLRSGDPLVWGRDRIGLGLLLALRAERPIVFTNTPTTNEIVPSESGHLVVCEEGDEIGQVIAANYAYSLGAGLCLIPAIPEIQAGKILDLFYSIEENREESVTQGMERLRDEMRALAGPLPIEQHRSVTFITTALPWGFAFPERPATHLFIYPDLGIALINAIVASQRGAEGVRVALLIDPGQVQAAEIEIAIKSLAARSAFVRACTGNNATVRNVSKMVEFFPYDLLLISTHCGDAPGWRWTYEFEDREGKQRKLVVELAIGVATTHDPERLSVMQFTRFVELDGVLWDDPDRNDKIDVGYALLDYTERSRDHDQFQPVSKEPVSRVKWSAALKMADNNYIAVPATIADNNSPIIFNNACASWHRLAGTFMFGGARAYIGTLISVLDVEAQEVVQRVLDRHFGKPLAVALWHAQNDVYQNSVRRPYILMGAHFQQVRTTAIDAPQYILKRMVDTYRYWGQRLLKGGLEDSPRRHCVENVAFMRTEISQFRERWFKKRS